uniref:Cyclic nucleotide-binding domain-containing protein n=1 Tax=Anopheles dirus TaxID=7168 RepID=A0A182MY57_9DIPT
MMLEEKVKRRRLARFRFKRLVRVVICNRFWIAEIEDRELGNNVHRNVAVIDRQLTRTGTLTIIEKKILNSPPEERTDETRRVLGVVLRKIECLRDFSEEQINDVAGCATFQYVEPGRVILREGHRPDAVYFLASGEVVVSKLQWDGIYKTHHDVPCGTRVPGHMFGEIALLQDCPRTASCTAATDCELLCLHRADFDRILKRTLLERWRQLQLALARFDYFKYWTNDQVRARVTLIPFHVVFRIRPAQVRECCLLSRIVAFEPQQKLPLDVDDQYAYFVLSGQCMILQCLTVAVTPTGYRLVPIGANESATATQTGPVEHRFIDVGTFSCGSVFGLGEAMPHRMVVARNRVQCLIVPRDWLYAGRQNVGNTWQRIRLQLDAAIQRRRLFERWVSDQRWLRHRKSLVQELVRRKPHPNAPQLGDVPILCRVEHE